MGLLYRPDGGRGAPGGVTGKRTASEKGGWPPEGQSGDRAVSRRGLVRCAGASHLSRVSPPGRGLWRPSSPRREALPWGGEEVSGARVLPVQDKPCGLSSFSIGTSSAAPPPLLAGVAPAGARCDWRRRLSGAVAVASSVSTAEPQGLSTLNLGHVHLPPCGLSCNLLCYHFKSRSRKWQEVTKLRASHVSLRLRPAEGGGEGGSEPGFADSRGGRITPGT